MVEFDFVHSSLNIDLEGRQDGRHCLIAHLNASPRDSPVDYSALGMSKNYQNCWVYSLPIAKSVPLE
jgi:hypothetical protein